MLVNLNQTLQTAKGLCWANGNKYVGQHKDGKANGKGIFTYANGDEYVGQHKNDKAHGYGTMKWKNGDKYFGKYANGKANGKGTFIYSNGSKYMEITKMMLHMDKEPWFGLMVINM